MLILLCSTEISGSQSSPGLLSGRIPSEIGLLTNLQILRFTRGALTGSIPVELGLLTEMFQLFCKCTVCLFAYLQHGRE